MKKTGKIAAAAMAGVMALSMAGCSGNADSQTEAAKTEAESAQAEDTSKEADASGDSYKIGVLQLTQHTALDKVNEGFVAAIEESGIDAELDQQNASGDQSACQTIAQMLVDSESDLIFAIATPAAQAVAGMTEEIPIVVSAVTDPADSGLVDSNEKPGRNVTGTSDLTPVKAQMDLLQKLLPDAEKVGILYSTAEANSEIQVEMAKEALEDAGIQYEEYTVSNTNEIQTVVESMVGNVDVIYTPTDNTIASGYATVAMVATENKIPTICGESGQVDEGGLVTYGVDYYELGRMAGEQAVEILTEGADIASMPIGYMKDADCELQCWRKNNGRNTFLPSGRRRTGRALGDYGAWYLHYLPSDGHRRFDGGRKLRFGRQRLRGAGSRQGHESRAGPRGLSGSGHGGRSSDGNSSHSI